MNEYPEWFLKPPHRPTPTGPGEEGEDELHLAVGRIAHCWESFEGSLYDLYMQLLAGAHPMGVNLGAYHATFSAVISSSGRRDMIDAMVSLSFHPDTTAAKSIRPILKLAQRAVGRRNDAVHGLVVRYNDMGLFVMPPRYAPMPAWEPGFKYRYDRDCLEEIFNVIDKVKIELNSAVTDLKKGAIGPFP